ncbi:MAG: TRAP transporter substrate-binding protein [bacterium]|nr:TRAP transporter substrate-binding protein [bacterium]
MNIFVKKASVVVLAVFCVLSFMGVNVSGAETYNIKLGVTVPPTSAQGQIVTLFKEGIEEKSDGRLTCELYFNAVMGNDSDLINKTQLGGQVQASQISTSNLNAQLSGFEVFDLPYIFDDAGANQKIFYENGKFSGPVTEKLQEDAKKKRLRLGWVAPINFRAACMSKQLVKTPADMEGLKIRTSASALEQACVKAFGGIPVAMGISEVYTALQTGTVDGETIPTWAAVSFKHLDAARKYSDINFQGFTEVLIFNEPFYQKLPDDLKQIIDETADEVMGAAVELYGKTNSTAVDEIKAAGGEWYELSAEEKALFAEKAQAVAQERVGGESIPQEWYDLVKSRIQ